MILSQEVQKRIADFVKYAQFISQQSGVRVVLDGLKAETDGKTVYLPNLASLSEKEVKFLYCILLHEVGHIKYSDFSVEAFKLIKSQNHFFLANAIEDARTENLSMKEFGGAEEIFTRLYNDLFLDEMFLEKLYGKKKEDVSEFAGIALYLHHYLLNLKNKIKFEEKFEPKVAQAVLDFVAKHDINTLLDKSPLRNWEEVVALANKVYDLYFQSKKDTSNNTNIEEMIKKIIKSKQDLNKDRVAPIQNSLDRVKEQQKNLDKIRKDLDPDITQLSSEIQKYEDKITELKAKAATPDFIVNQTKFINQQRNKLDKKLEHIRKATEQLAKSQEKQQTDKVAKLQETLERHQKLKKRYEDSIQDSQKEIEDRSKKFPPITKEEFSEQSEPLVQDQEKLLQEKGELLQKIAQEEQKLSSLQREHSEVVKEQSRLIAEDLVSAQKQLSDAGIDLDLFPQFEGVPGWDDATEVQQEFDMEAQQETGDAVCGGHVSNVRDLIVTLEEAQDKLEKIDLAKIFQTSNSTNPLESFNLKSTSPSDDAESFEDSRAHVPLTKQFDTIEIQHTSDRQELQKIISDNTADFETIKNIFRIKFKVAKKLKFRSNQEEGGIDQRSLWQLASKTSDRIFELPNPKIYNETKASIVVDVSGSMELHEEEIKKIALMLSEGLTASSVKHEVIGYHAPVCTEMRDMSGADSYNRKANRLETVVYRNFNDSKNSGIQNIKTHCSDNSDGESIQIAGKRLLKEAAKRRVMFLITDGKPFLSESNVGILDQDLRATINWLLRSGVEIYAVGFDAQGTAFYKSYCQCGSNSDLIAYLKNIK